MKRLILGLFVVAMLVGCSNPAPVAKRVKPASSVKKNYYVGNNSFGSVARVDAETHTCFVYETFSGAGIWCEKKETE